MKNPLDFINEPIDRILEDSVLAVKGIGVGIETYPLAEYVLQSVFIKMTGFQEQKLKSILWQVMTKDIQTRFEMTRRSLPDYSTFDDKNALYTKILELIKIYEPNFNISETDRKNYIIMLVDKINNLFNGSLFMQWFGSEYSEVTNKIKLVDHLSFASNKGLFDPEKGKELKNIYNNYLYRNRNRIAHNAFSYQINSPNLKEYSLKDHLGQSYIMYYSVLMIIDWVFIVIANKYLKTIDDNV